MFYAQSKTSIHKELRLDNRFDRNETASKLRKK